MSEIKEIHQKSRKTYGSPRVHAELQGKGVKCSRKRVAKIMKKNDIQAKMKKRFKKTTITNPKAQAAPNLLKQDFSAPLPNQRWVADITYSVPGAQGKQGCLKEPQIYLKYPGYA
ncbi:IS3 family transposase (plasmid) [Legionella pneumophila]